MNVNRIYSWTTAGVVNNDKILKSVINRNKKTKFQDKFKFNDGSYTTDMKIICEKFNDFFINVGPSLSKKIPPQKFQSRWLY